MRKIWGPYLTRWCRVPQTQREYAFYTFLIDNPYPSHILNTPNFISVSPNKGGDVNIRCIVIPISGYIQS